MLEEYETPGDCGMNVAFSSCASLLSGWSAGVTGWCFKGYGREFGKSYGTKAIFQVQSIPTNHTISLDKS